jgi:hypothetical protein
VASVSGAAASEVSSATKTGLDSILDGVNSNRGTKSTGTGSVASASGTDKSSADKIILASGSSGSFFGLVGAVVFGLLAL